MKSLRRYSLEVAGREKRWAFDIWAKPEHVEEWRTDGLTVDEVVEIEWIARGDEPGDRLLGGPR